MYINPSQWKALFVEDSDMPAELSHFATDTTKLSNSGKEHPLTWLRNNTAAVRPPPALTMQRSRSTRRLRAHEVMLNQAASAFEHAVTITLVTLNGGAAAAFLTLLGAISKNGVPYQPWFAGFAVLAWSAGLVIASFAARYGLKNQQEINAASRIMRE